MDSEICNVVERTVKPDVLQPCIPTVFFLNLNSIIGLFTVICNLTVVLSNDDQTKNRLYVYFLQMSRRIICSNIIFP